MERKLDVGTWRRREHFQLFLRSTQPYFSVTVDVDVTALWARCREPSAPSFFLSAIFLALRAINATEALRLRLRGDEVWLHDAIGLGTAIMRDDGTFGFARFDLAPTFREFAAAGQRTIDRVKASRDLDPQEGRDDLVYHTTLPWLRFTSFTNAITANDSIPRIAFGKCGGTAERTTMPMSIEVHHALVDGLDVGTFVQRFQEELGNPGEMP